MRAAAAVAAAAAAAATAESSGELRVAGEAFRVALLANGAAARVESLLGPEEREQVRAAERAAWRGPAHFANESRRFGGDSGYSKASAGSGHLVTYLHQVVDAEAPGLLPRIEAAVLAAETWAGWGVRAVAPRLRLRCVEALRYSALEGEAADAQLGWHTDTYSLLTAAVLLADPGEYEGGEFEVDAGAGPVRVAAAPGDVVVWKSWELHRVRPVRRGTRAVLVLEWWEHQPPDGLQGRWEEPRVAGDDYPHWSPNYPLELCRLLLGPAPVAEGAASAPGAGSPALLGWCGQELSRAGLLAHGAAMLRRAAELRPSVRSLDNAVMAQLLLLRRELVERERRRGALGPSSELAALSKQAPLAAGAAGPATAARALLERMQGLAGAEEAHAKRTAKLRQVLGMLGEELDG